MKDSRGFTIAAVLFVLPAIVMPELPQAWADWLDWWLTALVLTVGGVPVLWHLARAAFLEVACRRELSAAVRHNARQARAAERRTAP